MKNVTQKLKKFTLRRVENNVGKGKNAGNQHFLLFPPCFQKVFYPGSLKAVIVWKRVTPQTYETKNCLQINQNDCTSAMLTKSFSPRVSSNDFTETFINSKVWPWTLPLLKIK